MRGRARPPLRGGAYTDAYQLGNPGSGQPVSMPFPGEMYVDYIKAYQGTPDTLEASLVRIRATAARLAAELAAVSFEPPEIPA